MPFFERFKRGYFSESHEEAMKVAHFERIRSFEELRRRLRGNFRFNAEGAVLFLPFMFLFKIYFLLPVFVIGLIVSVCGVSALNADERSVVIGSLAAESLLMIIGSVAMFYYIWGPLIWAQSHYWLAALILLSILYHLAARCYLVKQVFDWMPRDLG